MKTQIRSRIVWLLLFAGCYLLGSYLVENDHTGKYIWSDAEGYYMYLPAVFVYGSFEDLPVRDVNQFRHYPGTQKVFTKYNYGVALLELPFYLGAYASLYIQKGRDPNVYYITDHSVAVLLAACFYGVFGLFFTWKTLRRYFSNRWAAGLTIATLLLGTNLLHYIIRAPGMSHVYSFFLFSLLVYLTPLIYQKPSVRRYLGYGLVFGLIVLIRPTNGIIGLYPFLYGVTSGKQLKNRLLYYREHFTKLIVALIPVIAVWLPQFYYWNYLSGSWLMDSYSTESFRYWDNPQISNVLFSVLNGYFTYNPVMLVPVVALFFMLKKNFLNSWATLLILILSTYIFASWWCWWFGGAFGHRCYVELLAILAFPLCFVYDKILKSGYLSVKTLSLTGMAIMVYYNFHAVMIYHWTWSHHNWTEEKYWEQVFNPIFFLN